MTFEKITRSYLKEFQNKCQSSWKAGASSIEMATRPEVHDYISKIIKICESPSHKVILHHDLSYTRYDRPDWRLEHSTNFGIFCFGDHKNMIFGKPLRLKPKEVSQINRYRAFGRPVFVFDGIEFLFFHDGKKDPDRVSILDKTKMAKTADWSKLPIDCSIESSFKSLLLNTGFRKWTENELIEQLGLRCRNISDDISFLLDAPKGSGTDKDEEQLLNSLHSLKKIITNHHDSALRGNAACADFIAQVLTFGLFYAHTVFASTALKPKQRTKKIRDFWDIKHTSPTTERLRPFKAIVNCLSGQLKATNALSEWYKEISSVLAHAEYMGTSKIPNNFHVLFEQFLKVFDEKARFDRGAFYTPQALSDWTVLASEEVSKKSLGFSIQTYAASIIDPCCGTGSFMESINKLFSTPNFNGQKLTGFEILPAPYALCHYRLSQIYSRADLSSIEILLTDTLSDLIHVTPIGSGNDFIEEKKSAVAAFKSELRLVIGNPPSSNHPIYSSPRTIIENLMEDFKPPKSKRTDRQNVQKALNNEAYRFLRWGVERVLETESGILAFVLPGAFCDAVSFQYARRFLLEHFKEIYLIEIDEDARKGNATASIFNVLQGRVVLIACHNGVVKEHARVFHASIAQKDKAAKYKFLQSRPDLSNFQNVTPNLPNWSFLPKRTYPIDLWLKCIPLTSRSDAAVYKSKCSGLKLSPTAALFHTSKAILLRRSYELSGTHKALPTKIGLNKWFKGQQKPPSIKKFTPEVQKALSVVKDSDITEYSFRPFNCGSVIENDKLFSALALAPGGGTRARPEIRKAFADKAIGIALAPAPADLGATLNRFACFAWHLPDNDLAARGNAMVYCNKFPQNKKKTAVKIKTAITSEVNFENKFLKYFSFSKSPETDASYYVYAVLSSEAYLDTFEGVLYKTADPNNPPRIPLLVSDADRISVSQLGKKIAECEKSDYRSPPSPGPDHKIDYSGCFKSFQLSKYDYDEKTQTLVLFSKTENVKISKVTLEIVSLSLCGHYVIDKWIRERKYNYLKRDFTQTDLDQLLNLFSAIKTQQSLIKKVDLILQDAFFYGKIIDGQHP